MIQDVSTQPPPATQTVDVCIVGSGCGGATAARVLAEGGREVLVLEEGPDLTGSQLTQREAAMNDQLYMDRGGRATDDMAISVLQGRALGGGGVINASDVVPMEDGVIEHWRTRHGLSELSPTTLAPYRALALKDLHANPITEAQVSAGNRVVRQGTEALGWAGELMMHNRVGCAGLGTCLIGCPLNAKRNPRFVAIPAAQQAGARIYVRARVVGLREAGQDLKTLEVRCLDPKGYHEGAAFTVRAKTVIIAANAVASAQLLLRSGVGNKHVGRHLMLQPQLGMAGLFPEPIDAFRGIPQSYAVTEFERIDAEHGLGGYRVEGIMGTPGTVASLLPRPGVEGKQLMAAYDRIAGVLCLVPDLPSGRVELTRSGRPRIRYEMREDTRARLRAAARSAARIFLAAGAQEVFVPVGTGLSVKREADLDQLDGLRLRPADAPLISAHQMGSLRMAASPKQGAIDPAGQVYGTRGVYVFDTSGFPSSASTHTMTPTITMARYLSARLLG